MKKIEIVEYEEKYHDDLKRISNLKIKTIISSKALFLKELKSSIDEVKSAKEGKTTLKSADQLLNEL